MKPHYMRDFLNISYGERNSSQTYTHLLLSLKVTFKYVRNKIYKRLNLKFLDSFVIGKGVIGDILKINFGFK